MTGIKNSIIRSSWNNVRNGKSFFSDAKGSKRIVDEQNSFICVLTRSQKLLVPKKSLSWRVRRLYLATAVNASGLITRAWSLPCLPDTMRVLPDEHYMERNESSCEAEAKHSIAWISETRRDKGQKIMIAHVPNQ